MLHRTRLANIGLVERSGSTDGHHLRERVFSCRLISTVMYPDRPAGTRKGQADGSTNSSGRTSHKHRTSLVVLVYLVHLVFLVYLVCPVYLVSCHQTDEIDQIDKGLVGLWEGYCAKASMPCRYGITLLILPPAGSL